MQKTDDFCDIDINDEFEKVYVCTEQEQCEFYKLCYANSKRCIKQRFDDLIKTLTLREGQIIEKMYGRHGYVYSVEELAADYSESCEKIIAVKEKALRKLRFPPRSRRIKEYFFDVFSQGDSYYSRLFTDVFHVDKSEFDDDFKISIKLGVDFSIVDKDKCSKMCPREIKMELNRGISEISQLQQYEKDLTGLKIYSLIQLLYTPLNNILAEFKDELKVFKIKKTVEQMGYKFRESSVDYTMLENMLYQTITNESVYDEKVDDLPIGTLLKLCESGCNTYGGILDYMVHESFLNESYSSDEVEKIVDSLDSKGLVFKNNLHETSYLSKNYLKEVSHILVTWMSEREYSVYDGITKLKEKNAKLSCAIYYISKMYPGFIIHPKIWQCYATNLSSIFDMPIENMDLTVRSCACLKRSGINTVSDLLERTEEEMKKIRNLSEKCQNEIKEKLCAFNLSYKTK